MLSRWSRYIGLALIGGGVAVTACGDDDGGGDGGDAGEGGADAGTAGKKTGGGGGMSEAGRGGTAGSTGGNNEGGAPPTGGTQSTAGSGGEGDAPSGGTSGSGNTGGTNTAGTSGFAGEAGAGGSGGSGDAGAGGSGGDRITGGAGGEGGSGGETDPPVIDFEMVATPNEIPLAPGGINWATLELTSESSVPLSVTLTAAALNGAEVDPASQVIQIPVNGSVSADVALLGTNVSTGTGGLMLVATPSPGGQTYAISKTVGVLFSDDMARNTVPTSSTYPKALASSSQANLPPTHAFDGQPTFWVSSGNAAGQGPRVEAPEWLGVDFGGAVEIGSVTVTPRDDRGPRNYTIQISDTGNEDDWTNVGPAIVDAPARGANSTVISPPVTSRYVRIHITASRDAGPSGCNMACPEYFSPRNTQVVHFEVRTPAP